MFTGGDVAMGILASGYNPSPEEIDAALMYFGMATDGNMAIPETETDKIAEIEATLKEAIGCFQAR